jgi:hypothetical protein
MRPKQTVLALLAVAALTGLPGCSGSEDELDDVTAPAPADSGAGLPGLDGNPEAAQHTGPIPVVEVDFSAAAPPEKQMDAVVDAANAGFFKEDGDSPAPKDAVSLLNRAIEVYGERRHETDDGDGPKWPVITDLNQLVRYRILRALPAAPPGQKFTMDPRTKVVTLEAQ